MYTLILIFLSSLQMLFAFRTNSYFSVDDFTVLNYFKGHTVVQMMGDFFLHGDVFHFRKILGYILFGTILKNFGVSPDPYIISMFIIQSINLVLLFLIVRFLTKRNFIAFFAAVIFNKFYLFYFANIHVTLGALFCLLAAYLFLKYPKKIYLACAAYVLALFSEELTYSLPFLLLSVSYIGKTDKRKTLPFFVILFLYVVYQSYFVFVLKSTPFTQAYGVTPDLNNVFSALFYYLSPYMIAFLFLLLLLTKKYKLSWILAVSFVTLLPVLFFGARRETYYLYIPIAYLLIYLSMFLTKMNLVNILIILAIVILFGGKSILPKIARQNYPNWQKVSMENVVKKVEGELSDLPQSAVINLNKVTLERDARLMLTNDVLDLFVNKNFSVRYKFMYNQGDNNIIATRI